MAKRSKKNADESGSEQNNNPYNSPAESKVNDGKAAASQEKMLLEKLPKDVQEKLNNIKAKLDKFQKKVLEKFDKYIVSIALLPPPQKQEQQPQEIKAQEINKEAINALVLVDDS
ncbi:MAG: hypothetical protein AABX34_05430, partial [Nanoarchaeota archaeon]